MARIKGYKAAYEAFQEAKAEQKAAREALRKATEKRIEAANRVRLVLETAALTDCDGE